MQGLWPWWMLLVLGAALGFAVAVLLVGRESEERRGGLLELDSWEARSALRHQVETIIGGVECGFARAQTRFLGRCGHLIQAGNEYVVRSIDGARFCSPRCVEASPTSHVRPFAGGGDEAA